MEIVKNIATIVGLIISVSALLCTTIPNLRSAIARWAFKDHDRESLRKEVSEIKTMLQTRIDEDQKISAELGKLTESQQCVLRNNIMTIYYQHIDDKTLHTYEMENLSHMKDAYDALDGNSFVGAIYAQMQDWTVIP